MNFDNADKKMQLASSERCFRSRIASALDYPTGSVTTGTVGRGYGGGVGKRLLPIPASPRFFYYALYYCG